MASYLEKLEQTSPKRRWALVRRWMDDEPLPFYDELREFRPILELPELTLVTRFDDCAAVLRQHDVFSVALYEPKQGDYWMAQDDTAVHWREKSIMRAVLDLEQLSSTRQFVANSASAILGNSGGCIEAVNGLCRAVPIALVQTQFGFDQSDPAELFEWSYWNQYDAFHNQPFDAEFRVDPKPEQIVAKRKAASEKLGTYLGDLVRRRAAEMKAGQDNDDPVTRLLKLTFSGALDFDIQRVARNVGGMLIGSVETTSHASINAIAQILAHGDILQSAVLAAAKDDSTEFDGYVFEALRFRPAFPYFFRVCEKPVHLSAGTDHERQITRGTTVLAVTHSAMFDETAFPDPGDFDPSRPVSNAFHFGQGLHECLGRHFGREMIAEIVRQVLLLPGIREAGPIDNNGGPVPEHYPLRWNACQT